MDSLSYLQEKLSHLQQKYPHRSRYCALRMVITSIHALFMRYNKNVHRVNVNPKFHKNKYAEPIIVFSVKGGLGDLIIACNYIFNFYKYADDITFKLKVCYHSPELLDAFCSDLPGVIELGMNINKMQGNLKIELNRFPRFLSGDMAYFARRSKKLERVFSAWHNFYIHNRKFFDFMPQMDGLSNEYAQILGSKRINQADIGGIIGLQEISNFPIRLKQSMDLLEQYHLNPKKYITLHRGKGITHGIGKSTKLWDLDCYNTLCQYLKKQYPSYQLVQIGLENEPHISGSDINLSGQTTVDRLCFVLKESILHIDGESGLIHLRHALQGGRSVVLFGPTSPEVYGYPENLNLRTTACRYPCEWVTNDWQNRCPRRIEKNCCMTSLTPEFVFENIMKRGLN